MQLTAGQLCQIVQGELEGDPEILVHKPSKIEEADAGSLSFLANPKYEHYLYSTKASVVLVGKEFKPERPVAPVLIRVGNVYEALGVLLARYDQVQKEEPKGVSELASIHPEATIGEEAYIGPFAVISAGATLGKGCRIYPNTFIGDNCSLGDDVTLHPGVIVYHGCVVGNRCIIHGNSVIGSDGFGYAPSANGSLKKIAQIGNVVLGDDVEVGSNTVIDRATMGSTVIKSGAKLDNLIQIAHNVEIGESTAVAAQAGIAGSTKIGRNVLIGGQAGFVGHIEVADQVQVQAQSGVASSVTRKGEKIYGSPALPYRAYLQSYAIFRELPALMRRIQALEAELAEMKQTHPQ